MPDHSQEQLFSVEPAVPLRLQHGGLPTYADVVLTADQVREAQETWPDRTEREQERNMKMRVLNQMRHEIIVDPATGRRAFGGAQDTRPKAKKRVDESLVEAADARVQEIVDAAFSALDPRNSPEVRHKAAMNITKEAREVRKHQIEEDELERSSNDEVKLEAARLLADMMRKGELKPADFDLTDADVVEVD